MILRRIKAPSKRKLVCDGQIHEHISLKSGRETKRANPAVRDENEMAMPIRLMGVTAAISRLRTCVHLRGTLCCE